MLMCRDASYYVGKTIDIEKRIRQHNGDIQGGAKYTRSKRPVLLVYKEKYTTNKDAAAREEVLKQLTHLEKKALIEKQKKS